MGVSIQSVICRASGRPEQVLAQQLGLSRRVVTSWLRSGLIRIESQRLRKGDRVHAGQTLHLALEGNLGDWVQPAPEPMALLAQTGDWFALNKPAGMPSHLNLPFETGTALNHFVAYDPACAEIGDDVLQGSLAHRLDNDASGTMIAARTPQAYKALRTAFADGDVRRVYRARVASATGRLPRGVGECRTPLIARGSKVVTDPAGRATHTLWRSLDRDGLLEIEIRTGHRHQIRVHLASQDYPILGDTLYGGEPNARLALHCVELSWANQQVKSPIPETLMPRYDSQ